MKSENLNKIKDLLIKYEAGKTSLEEEKYLIAFFNLKDVPQELAAYRAEFNYYATFRNINFTGSINEPLNSTKDTFFKKTVQFFSKWFTVIIIVVLPVILFILIQQDRQTKEVITTPYQYSQNRSTPLNIDSTTTEKIISQLDTTPELENKNHPAIFDNSPLQKKDSTTSDDFQLQLSDSIIRDTSPLQKKDSVIISEPDINKIPVIDSASIEDIFLNNTPNRSKDRMDSSRPTLEKTVFNITEKTTSGELAAIARKARQVGIEYTYIVDQHKKKIHELNIVMIILSTGERSQLWISFPKKSSFLETIYWSVDENGQAASLCPVRIEHRVKAKHPIK